MISSPRCSNQCRLAAVESGYVPCCLYLPACEFVFTQTHLEAVATVEDLGGTLDVAIEFVTLNSVDAPGALTWTQLQARLLGVDGEHRKLGLSQSACKQTKVGKELNCVLIVQVLMGQWM